MAESKYLDLVGLQKYDEKIKEHLSAADAAILAEAKKHVAEVGSNYDPAGTAATKVQELAEGAVKANTEAIAKLNGDDKTEGSVAKAVADAKAAIDEQVGIIGGDTAKNKSDIADLKGRMDEAEENIGINEKAIEGLEGRMTPVENDVKAIKEDIGNVDNLQTVSKNLTEAVNEAIAAIGTGGTAAVVAVTAKGATADFANVYEISQGGTVVGTINIPKDMVVESGEVVDVDGVKNIKIVLQNVEEPLYIPVGSLVDIYVAQAEAAQVQVEINANTREVSAYIVPGSVTSTEIADNAIITAKIADNNVTKAKLSAEVRTSLEKADTAEENAKAHADSLDEAMDLRMQAVEKALAGSGEGSVEEKIEEAKQAAIAAAAEDATTKANTAETNAKNHATNLDNAMNARVVALEAVDHVHANATVLDGITAEKVVAWDSASGEAAGALLAAKTELEGKISAGDAANKALIDDHKARIEGLEAKVGDGFVEITVAEIEALFNEQA